jgi:hypothetical protein
MTYVYDLLINLNDYDYKFYEWRESDIIEYLKKSVLIKVSDYIYKKILTNNIIIGNKTLEMIKDKSCILKNKRIETITYMGIFTNGKDVIGLTFSSDGKMFEKTRFTIQDELELLEISKPLKYTKIDYKKISNNKYNISIISRDDMEDMNKIISELKNIKDDKDKINYLYYEWFNKKSKLSNPYEELIDDIKKNYSNNKEFLKLLNLINIKNSA